MKCSQNNQANRGAVALWVVILIPVLLGLAGFALDLGILYTAKGELKTGANALALAAAQQLNGTDASTAAAEAASQLTVQSSAGSGNKYYFQGLPIGQTTGTLASVVSDPAYYATAADAIASGAAPGGEVTGSQAKYVRITVTGETPLLFWSLLPNGNNRKVPVLATAVAGVSAPLCLACGIEPIAVAAINASDTTDFGFTSGVKYSFAYLCIVVLNTAPGVPPSPPPAVLAGASQLLSYVLLNRLDLTATVFPDETSQAYRDAAGGLPGSSNTAQACFRVNNTEVMWANASVNLCRVPVTTVITSALCGLDSRFESGEPAGCANVVSLDTLSTVYQPDTDVNTYTVYTDYAGNGRRIITIPIVDQISSTTAMTVLGFRQFLLIPAFGASNINPGDINGRFVGMYIGSVAPLTQGRFDGCTQAAGPGKVVLHQ